MADLFEQRTEFSPWRERLWELVRITPSLDWLLLTKRPEAITDMVPWRLQWPENVWVGTTAENQHWARKRIPHLVAIPAVVRFVSAEPLLGPLNVTQWIRQSTRRIDWIIAGGESGAHARPMNPDWLRALRDQCVAHGVAFHFKQWGQWCPDAEATPSARRMDLQGLAGKTHRVVRLTKAAAGRVLDGRTWDGLPDGALRERRLRA